MRHVSATRPVLPASRRPYQLPACPLVNCAGRDPKFSIEEGDERAWDELINLNLRSQYLLIRQLLLALEAGAGKAIGNVSSINYRLGVPRRTIYTVSKTGILGLTCGLVTELGSKVHEGRDRDGGLVARFMLSV